MSDPTPGRKNQIQMNRIELTEVIAKKHDLSKAEAARVLTTVQEAVVGELKRGGSVTLPGFGTFKVAQRAAREGRNPATGASLKIPAGKVPKFSPGSAFKDAVDPKAAARKAAKAGKPVPAKAVRKTKA